MLRAYNWEPVQLLDSVQTGWKNIIDMTTHKDQLVRLTRPADAFIFVLLVRSVHSSEQSLHWVRAPSGKCTFIRSKRVLRPSFRFEQNLKTKRRISPVRDYFPSDLKAPSAAASAMSGRRSQYQAMAVKDEHVK